MGGTEAIPNQFPWMAHLLLYNTTNNQMFTCVGTLVSNKHIITASSCFHDKLGSASLGVVNVKNITLGAHDFSANSNDRNRQVVTWSQAVHITDQLIENDIIIFTLMQSVNFTGNHHLTSVSL
jgi:secreted trypsin-like serine protease